MPIAVLSPRSAAALAAVAFGLSSLIGTAPVFAKTEILVYTAVEADELAKFKTSIEKAVPDVTVKWVRDSTGVVTSKLLAEKDNPQADLVWGLAASSLVLLASQNYFMPYAPKGLDRLDKAFYDTKNPTPLWVGQRAFGAAICVNTVEVGKKNLPKPASWQDLTKPAYKGHLIMPNPNSSGTGFLDVSAWLQMWGEEKGWAYMDALHENMARYVHSGSAPCRLAASGEIPIGVSFAYRAVKSKQDGAPIDMILPSEGLGWDVEAFGVVQTTKHAALVKQIADWSITREAMELYASGYEAVAMPGVPNPTKELENVKDRFIKNDFVWAAANRERILKEWQRRYDTKSDKR